MKILIYLSLVLYCNCSKNNVIPSISPKDMSYKESYELITEEEYPETLDNNSVSLSVKDFETVGLKEPERGVYYIANRQSEIAKALIRESMRIDNYTQEQAKKFVKDYYLDVFDGKLFMKRVSVNILVTKIDAIYLVAFKKDFTNRLDENQRTYQKLVEPSNWTIAPSKELKIVKYITIKDGYLYIGNMKLIIRHQTTKD